MFTVLEPHRLFRLAFRKAAPNLSVSVAPLRENQTPDLLDPASLPAIGEALDEGRWLPRLPPDLSARFHAFQDGIRRPINRWVIVIFTVVFNLFWLAQFHSAPELVLVSGVLRLAVFTPCVLLFLRLDRLGKLRTLYDPALAVLAIAPNVISAVLCMETTSLTSLADVRATPLILLTTGLIWRMSPAAVIIDALVSMFAFVGGICLSAGVPKAELGSLILTDVAIGLAVIVFSLQLEARDRRVFLLNSAERIHRRELALRNAGLLRQAQTDALTGVSNRRHFDEALEAEWRAGLDQSEFVGLIMIDIDHFKRFNDHYGHQGGDDCLRRVASEIQRLLRPGDTVSRYGGEEFAVIMRNVSPSIVTSAAERIRAGVAAMALPHAGLGPDATVTISLGVATAMPGDAQGTRGLLAKADNCLYAAKRDGRNRVSFESRNHPGASDGEDETGNRTSRA